MAIDVAKSPDALPVLSPLRASEMAAGASRPSTPAAPAAGSFFSGDESAMLLLQRSDPLELEELPGESDDGGGRDEEQALLIAATARQTKKRKKDHTRIVFSTAGTKYPVVVQAVRGLGWRNAKVANVGQQPEEANVYWVDSYISKDTYENMNRHQKANHFPGTSEIAKKNLLSKNLNRMQRLLPDDFGFFPPTFLLPTELEALKAWAGGCKRKPTIIVKPDAGCQVRGTDWFDKFAWFLSSANYPPWTHTHLGDGLNLDVPPLAIS